MRRFGTLFALCVIFAVGAGLGTGCAGTDDPNPGANCHDNDGDGFDEASSKCSTGRDCNDDNSNIHPDAEDVCGDGIDQDCSGSDCTDVCVDEDGDGWGNGGGCEKQGTDCDDSDADINPGADEVCGNDVDENCDDDKKECTDKCTDEDGDGYGIEGENSGCDKDTIDCDDSDEKINPGADEVCDDVDNNCNMMKDECPNGGTCQERDGETACRAPLGSECTNNKECEQGLKCDTGTTPSECRKDRGAGCSGDMECLSSLSCNNSTCSGGWCEMNGDMCKNKTPVCDGQQKKCVECKYWGMNPGSSCESDEGCIGNGWCGKTFAISKDNALETVGGALADCWTNWDKEAGRDDDDMCGSFDVAGDVSAQLDRQALKKAIDNDQLSGLSSSQKSALKDIYGYGATDLDNLKWPNAIQSGQTGVMCVWVKDDRSIDNIVVKKCSQFTLPL